MTSDHPHPIAVPLSLPCGTVLANRLVKAAMSEQLADADNDVSAELVGLYARWASSGCGVLITGNMMVDRHAISEPRQVVVDPETDRDRLTQLAQAARLDGAAVWAQLNHAGRQIPRSLARDPMGPSSVPMSPRAVFARPRAMTDAEITRVADEFAYAAATVQAAGFDGVEIHAAHGYLISQFLSPRTNQRDDRWGGDPDRRSLLLVRTVRAVRATVGPRFPVAVKINSSDFQRGGLDEDEALQIIDRLDAEQVDVIEISGGTFEASAMVGARVTDRTRTREAYFGRFAEAARRRTRTPLLLTGGFRTLAAMDDAVAGGAIDLIGLARPLVADPRFAVHLLAGRTDSMDLRPRRLHSRRLDGLTEIAWYTRQIRRLAAGLDPTRATTTGALGAHLATTFRHSHGTSRRR